MGCIPLHFQLRSRPSWCTPSLPPSPSGLQAPTPSRLREETGLPDGVSGLLGWGPEEAAQAPGSP